MTSSDDPRWTAALAVLDRVAPADEAPLVVRDGAALLVRRGAVVVRVRPAVAGLAVARREVAVARALIDVAVPVAPLVSPDGQPWVLDDMVVTAWRWVDAIGPARAGHLGVLARALRERTARVSAGIVAFDPIATVLGVIAHLPDHDDAARFLRDRAEELTSAWQTARASDPLGQVIVHGDLHVDNVILAAEGPLLTDLELSGSGPASYDAAAAVVAVHRFGADPGYLDAFIEGFGADPRSWDGFTTFVAVDELWATAWAVGVRHLDPAWAGEAERRVRSLRDGAELPWLLS